MNETLVWGHYSKENIDMSVLAAMANGTKIRVTIGEGTSGRAFSYSKDTKDMPAHNTWHKRHKDDSYRKEWDTMAKTFKPELDPQNPKNFKLISDALYLYAHKMVTANERGVEVRPNAKFEATREAKAAASVDTPRPAKPKATPKSSLDSAQAAGVKVNHAKPESQSAPRNVTPVKDDYRLEDTPGYADFKLKADAKYAAYEKKLDDQVDQWMVDNVGMPVVTMWSMSVAPTAGLLARGTVTTLGGSTLLSNGTGFAVAGTTSLGAERIKNASFGLQNTTGGDASAFVFGGLGGTSIQYVKLASPTLSKAANGGISGAAGNFSEQAINMLTGEQKEGLKFNDLAANTLIGTSVGALVPDIKVKGFNSGRNNYVSIHEANNTRLLNGNIGQMNVIIPIRAGAVNGGDGLLGTVTNAFYQGAYNKVTNETPPK
jgi:hypothetical protein